MNSRQFYSIFAFTVAFMIGLIANWMVNKQYVGNYNNHSCPYSSQSRIKSCAPLRDIQCEASLSNYCAHDSQSRTAEFDNASRNTSEMRSNISQNNSHNTADKTPQTDEKISK